MADATQVVSSYSNFSQNGTAPEEEEWSVDTSEEAVKKRQKEDLSSQVATLALTSDLEKTVSERVNMFYEFVKVRVY